MRHATLVLIMAFIAAVGCQERRQFVIVTESGPGSPCRAEILANGWTSDEEAHYVELVAKCRGSYLHCFMRVPIGGDKIIGQEIEAEDPSGTQSALTTVVLVK